MTANAYVPDKAKTEAVAALESARGFLKRELTKRMNMYRVPEFHFESDVNAELAGRLEQLRKRIKRGRPRDVAQAQPPQQGKPTPQ